MRLLKKLFICVLTLLMTVLYSGLPVKAEEQYTVTFDPNGGTMENSKTVTKTSGSTYGFLAGEGKHFTSAADNELLGYANYDFGSAITISTKVSLDTFDKGDQEWFNNFEDAGFGFGYLKQYDSFYFDVHTNGIYHEVYVKRKFSENEAFWITGVYDASVNRMDVYINGELQKPCREVHNSNYGKITVSPAGFLDGANPAWNGNAYVPAGILLGTLYKAGIWTTAMSQEQINDMVNNDYINSAALINLDYAPRRVGYSFDGWHEDVNNPNTKITSTAKVAKNTALHAKWTAHSYTVQYKPNGATSGAVADTAHSYNDDSTLAVNSFERPGYVFGGWNTEPDGSGKTYYSGQKVSNLTDKDGATVTLYAVWAPDADVFSFTIPTEITATSNGSGKISDDIQFTTTTEKRRWMDVSITSEDEFSLIDNQDSNNKIDYSLSETSFKVEPQYTDSDSKSFVKDIKLSGNDTSIAGDYSDTVNFNVSNYYETRTITLDCNGGNVNGESQIMYTVRDGSAYGQLPVPSKNGFEFVGWKDENDNTIYSGSTVLSETEKLTAKYSQRLQINIFAEINGIDNGSIEGIGTADLYKNGELSAKGTNALRWQYGIEGDVFRIDNIQIYKEFKCVKYTPCDGYTVNFNEDGSLESIDVTLTAENTGKGVTLCFESSSQLQTIINNTNANTVTFDSDIPTVRHTSTGALDIFNTKADTYCSDNILHIYNPDGGKVKAPSNCEKLFAYLKVEILDFKNLDTSNVTDCTMMFSNTTARQIFLNDCNTSKITSLESMFYYCRQLEVLDLSNWNTSNVTSTYQFLWYCNKLISIDVSSFDTSNVFNMGRMFGECYNLTEIKGLENFDTRSSNGFAAMFQSCNTLKELDVSSFDTSNASWLLYMFFGCRSLEKIKGLENFNTSKNKSFGDMFAFCANLKELDLSSFDTSCSIEFNYMFQACTNLQSLNLSNFNTEKAEAYTGMFSICKNLKNIYVSKNFENTSIATSTSMFDDCPNLVGGAGTAYDPAFTDATAARIDGGSENPGYFTDIKDKPAESVADQTASDKSAIDIPTTGDYIEDESQEQQIETTAPAPAATPSADNSNDEEDADINK